MKTLVVKGSGTVTEGDMVILSYRSPRGGRSDAKYLVRNPRQLMSEEALRAGEPPPPLASIADIIAGLASTINSEKSEWCPGSGDFRATAKGDTLYVQCSDTVSNVSFGIEVTGAQTEKFELRELARA